MARPVRLVIALMGLCVGLTALASTTWTQPTPEELKMTSDPKAPGAPAVFLSFEEWTGVGGYTVYARVKILTEKGREEYSDVRVEHWRGEKSNMTADGRTIHPDGTVVPFTGKPYDKELISYRGFSEVETVFSLPDVQVGSILEYRYQTGGGSTDWYIQQNLFVHKGVFHYSARSEWPMHMTQVLPPGVKVKGTPTGGYDLEMDDIPPLPDEEDSPPMHALGYRVDFLYTEYTSAAEYWKSEGKDWSGNVNDVTAPSGKVKEAVDQMVAPGDTNEQALRKIYAAVMKLENTDFTREHTREENKAQKIKIKTANDIWTAQRGDGEDLTLLFVTMARAAKLKAYVMYVTDRSNDIFLKDVPNWRQLDAMIAIVEVDGKEMYFDPGERYCEFGKLKWTHTWTGGLRQTSGSGSELGTTPTPAFAETDIVRKAELQMDADGSIHGTLHITMTGNEALRWRQEALSSDEDATKKKLDDYLQGGIAPGVHLKTSGFTALADYTQPLLATVDVTGTMGTKTGHRIFVPGTFFEAQAKAPYASTTRETPVYMHYPYVVEDQFKLNLPANMSVDSVPQDAQIPFMPNADFTSKYRGAATAYAYARRVRVANILYDPKEYPDLRGFFQKVSTQDQQQVVIKVASATDSGAAAGSLGKTE